MKALKNVFKAAVLVASMAGMTAAQDTGYVVTIGDAIGLPGDEVQMPLSVEIAPGESPIVGLSFSILNPDQALIPVGIFLGDALAQMNGGNGPDFFSAQVHFGPAVVGFTCGVVFDFTTTVALGQGAHHLLNLEWLISSSTTPGTTTSVEFCDCIGSPPIPSSLVSSPAVEIVPVLEGSTVIISDEIAFIRGDSNGDGSVNLADPITTLAFLFLNGPGVCLDAMDVDGNGVVSLGDAITSMYYVNGVGPIPAAPFPGCGSAEELGCEISSCP